MDFEFDNARFWGEDNDGKPPARRMKPKSKIAAKPALGAASPANDEAIEKPRPLTPSPHTSFGVPLHTSTSLYTSSENSGAKRYPADPVARLSLSRQTELVAAPARNSNPQTRTSSTSHDRSGRSATDGQIFKYGRPVLPPPLPDGQNFKYGQPSHNSYRGELQRPQNQDFGRRTYTNTTPSAPGSRPHSRPQSRSQSHTGRSSLHRGSDIDGIEGEEGFRSAYIVPNLYLSDPHILGLGPDGYEGPDGFLRDNDADRAERAGFPPDSLFSMPLRRHPEFDERFFGPRNSNLRHIAVKTNTHLSMPTDVDIPDIQIWGTPDNIILAKRDLQALMDHITIDIEDNAVRVGGTWAKINAAPSDRKQARIDKISRESAVRRRYRQAPEEGTSFSAIGVFVWPTKEINPQTSLGMAFEALDAVRFDCEVYIIFSRKRSMFRVLGNDPRNVDIAIDRIYGAFCEIASKNRRPSKRFLVHPPSMKLRGISVRIVKDHNLEGRQVTIKRLPGNVGVQVFLTGDYPSQRFLNDWRTKREIIERTNYIYLKRVVQQGLNDVCYFRGYSTLKIHFGTLLLFGYKKPTGGKFELEDFCQMMGDPQTAGEVLRYIGTEGVARAVIEECDANRETFHPAESRLYTFNGYNADGTPEIPPDLPPGSGLVVEPALYATFEIRMYDDKGQTNDIRLEVKFELVPGDHPSDMTNEAGELWRVGMRRWLHVRSTLTSDNEKTGDAFTRRKGPFEIKVFDVERDLAWQIELSAYPLYKDTDIYPIFAEFSRKLRVEEIPDETDSIGIPAVGEPDRRRTVKRISYVNLPGMTVEAVIMKTKYQYWIHGTSYFFEITKYEHFDTSHVNHLYPDGIAITWKGLKTNHDIRWGASLTNTGWLNTLSKQQGLGIGCVGGWDPDIDEFFKSSSVGGFDHPPWTRDRSVMAHGNPDPWDGDGFREMHHRIGEFARMIARIRDKTLNASMSVCDDEC